MNINTNSGGVGAHRRASVRVIKTGYNSVNDDGAWREKHSEKINTLALSMCHDAVIAKL